MADLDKSFWGLVEESVLQRIVVVSPHFDDAALGAAHVLGTYPGSTVITVMAGWPPSYPEEPTDWDACGGFVAGDDVVAARREEDLAALEVLERLARLARRRRPPVPCQGATSEPARGGAVAQSRR